MQAESLKFSELKPKGMESNIFMYHLKYLINEGLVKKSKNGYGLSAKGLNYVDGLSSTNLRLRKQPKLIAILTIQNSEGHWLLAKRKTQPYINKLMYPSGKHHIGETLDEHLKRESLEKFGTQLNFKYFGLAEIEILDGDTLMSHVLANVYYCKANISLPYEDERFSYQWHPLSKASDNLMPGTLDLCQQILKKDSIFKFSQKYTV